MDSICCCSPAMASKDGILETEDRPGPALPSSSFPCGVLGGVGGWWCEGGPCSVPCRAADNMPGWGKAESRLPTVGLSVIKL